MQALQTAGVWETVKPKLIYGDNIRQTLQFAETGNVDVAIVAVSLISGSEGQWSVVPAELHQPLNQGLAVIRASKHEREARLFADYVLGSTGRRVLQKYGFELPSP
jgi:molybdate transport system substrate-binding protein